ncbi:hypothetical protein C4573_06265 [Candidatus Woesearchaeota archaeon]|nr:MAG: hypothetical protein C4573_06265 [Candidatus Woesearchaeota archaeon]
MKDMQTVEKYQQSEADKWAKKDQDIRLQVCFKKAIDVEIHLIKGAQALSEAEITARILQRAESYFKGYSRLRQKLVEGISDEEDDDDSAE